MKCLNSQLWWALLCTSHIYLPPLFPSRPWIWFSYPTIQKRLGVSQLVWINQCIPFLWYLSIKSYTLQGSLFHPFEVEDLLFSLSLPPLVMNQEPPNKALLNAKGHIGTWSKVLKPANLKDGEMKRQKLTATARPSSEHLVLWNDHFPYFWRQSWTALCYL